MPSLRSSRVCLKSLSVVGDGVDVEADCGGAAGGAVVGVEGG